MPLSYALLADGDVTHRVLAAALASIWGWRLGLYLLFDRVLGKEGDGRYQALQAKWGERANRRFFWLFQPIASATAINAKPTTRASATRACTTAFYIGTTSHARHSPEPEP